jgi:alginate O-acetyltransferase complex protein AlgI
VPWTLHVILPLGISFYTFQALSYTIDVYRGELHATTSYSDFLLAVLYFPHLVAGPIQRAINLLPQVANPRHPNYEGICAGIHLMVWGYFKKVYIADNLAPLVNRVFSEPHPHGFHVLMAAYGFAFQIYCDFSGYTDIARGIAKLMGFEFMVNFNLPYLAAGPAEFWSRWHISLSTWLRDYLYVPLGGNRKGRARTYVNSMITMAVGGLWHGAAWTFLLWGFYHGILLVTARAIGIAGGIRIPRWIRVVAFFHLTCFGWLIFRAGSFAQLSVMTAALARPFGQIDVALASRLLVLIAPLLAVQMIQWITKQSDFLAFRWSCAEARTVCYAVLVYLVLFCGGEPRSFIYFQF